MNTQAKETLLSDYTVPSYLVDSINLHFHIEKNKTVVKTALTFSKNILCESKDNDLFLNGVDLELTYVEVDGKRLESEEYNTRDDGLIIFNVPPNFHLLTEVNIYPEKNTALEGLYASKTGLFTQCEAEGFRKITFFPDRPDIMTKYTTTINADREKYPVLLSNGNLVDSGHDSNNRHWVKWEDPFLKPSYLFALVAADLDLLEDKFTTQSGRKVDLNIYVEPGKLDQSEFALSALKESMQWDERVFGLEIDLDQYSIVAVSDFNMGAMENKGLNIFNTKYVLASPETATDNDFMLLDRVVAHEYFHNWTGNRVTCRDWFQLSLKEGLTVFRDQQYGGDRYSHGVQRIQEVRQLRSAQFSEDSSPMAHPVRPTSYMEISNFYTATIYEKGAEVVRMIHTILGAEKFRSGMDLYFQRHDGQAVRIEEFLSAMEDASKIDLSQMRPWYDEAGTPTVNVEKHYDPEKKRLSISFTQQSNNPNKTNQPRMVPIKIGVLDEKGKDALITADNTDESGSLLIKFTEERKTIEFDNMHSVPTPSILRNFSAPITLNISYSDKELAHLAKFDKDSFNRWEAFQRLAVRHIIEAATNFQKGSNYAFPNDILEVFEKALDLQTEDPAMTSEMITLPPLSYLCQFMDPIEPDALSISRIKLRKFLAANLESRFIETIRLNDDLEYFSNAPVAVGRRSLKNNCLSYLLELEKIENFDECLNRLKKANNMTDAMAALNGLSNFDYPQRKEGLTWFRNKWKREELVMDKWFTVQALSRLDQTLDSLRDLTKDEYFSIKNPNKVRALIGAFCHGNMALFHQKTGEGYAFCAENIKVLDDINPQIAARLSRAFDQWRKFDSDRQVLAQKALESVLNKDGLSKDTYEVINKTLGN